MSHQKLAENRLLIKAIKIEVERQLKVKAEQDKKDREHMKIETTLFVAGSVITMGLAMLGVLLLFT